MAQRLPNAETATGGSWEPVCVVTTNLHCSSSVLTSQSCIKICTLSQFNVFLKTLVSKYLPSILSVFLSEGSRLNRQAQTSFFHSSSWLNTKELQGQAGYLNPPVCSGCAPPGWTRPQAGISEASWPNQTTSANEIGAEVALWDPSECLSTVTQQETQCGCLYQRPGCWCTT